MNHDDTVAQDVDYLTRMFIESDRGIVLAMRALAICSKIMLEEEFMGDADIYKDRTDMVDILKALNRCYEVMYEGKKYDRSEEPAIQTLNKIFPGMNWDL
tara:strand:+ start:39 stop:338 length:300 start_codon:yes stop_codon:yes gene_type:complete